MGAGRRGLAAQAAIVCVLVLALRLPFLTQAIQGDDFYYLKGAEHAQIDPLHPTHAHYVFLGEIVDMRGHSHPPLDAWFLAAILAVTGDEREIPYHAVYIVWSLMAGLGMLALARRFVPARALAATLLFCATLPFIINGTSLESDLPLLGCWTLAAAFFVAAVDRKSLWRVAACFIFGALAGLAGYQAVVLIPILAVYAWYRARRWIPAWIALLGPAISIGAYQLFERISSGSAPAGVLAGYLGTHGFQAAITKLKSAVALTVHAGWIVFPVLAWIAFRRRSGWTLAAVAAVTGAFFDANPLFWASLATGVAVVFWCAAETRKPDLDTRFLAMWAVLFFAAALVLFFAGSARYLLPMTPAVTILAARQARSRWLLAGAVANALVGLLLAVVNWQHWDGYRVIAASLKADAESRRVWVNGEWGLRHYLEAEGGLPYETGRFLRPGDLLVSSSYARPIEMRLAPVGSWTITSAIPVRIVALGARSGYSSVAFGLRPFDISRTPMDVVRSEEVLDREAKLSRIVLGTREAADQIISGTFNNDRWMSGRAVLMLRRPASATRIVAVIYVPPSSPARTFTLSMNGELLTSETFRGPGQYTLAAAAPAGDQATITITADRTFTAPPDTRALSALLLSAAFE